jgi:hypothetical protein
MNQQLGIYLAVAFLSLVGLFNMVYALSNFKKRRARKGILWFRFIFGFFVFGLAAFLGYELIWIRLA